MNLQIARWGNSLAVRLPSDVAKRLGVREGDTLSAQVTVDGGLALRPAKWSRAAFVAELAEAHATMPMGTSVIEQLRSDARY